LPKEIRKVFSKHFPSIEFFIMYGATEASARLAYLEPSKFSSKLEAIGKAIPNVELKVITDSCTEAKPGEQGEIAARGSNIMSGYWNAPEETGRVLRDGWYFTGDLGYRDHDGDFYVTGRKRDMIKVGPHKVSAQEIEEVVLTIAGVEESAAIGVPDPDFGEIVKVFVVADAERRTAGAESIIEHCRTLLPAYKVPKNVQFTDALPRNEAGKILKRALAERLERHDEDANSSDTDSTTDEDRAAVNAVPGRSPN
jgi:long-chain acyl-CoA synthetase